LPGQFQPYNHTLPDRYPWLFGFAAEKLAQVSLPNILSFGCSRGDEVLAIRRYFPNATITGIDVDPGNIMDCRARLHEVRFEAAATTEDEASESYDAIFCLAVLCHGDLTSNGAETSEPLLFFDVFERVVTDFARCLKPGGLLILHTTNFRFGDTAIASEFEVMLEAQPAQLAHDVVFDRHNRLMRGERYRPVVFRKSRAPQLDG
jgi:SAM-dependent methyltransferase